MTQPPSQPQDLQALRAFGDTPEQMQAEFQKALTRFQETASARQDHWLTRPAEGRWSPAQVTEHVLIVNEGVGRIVSLLLSDRELRPVPTTPGQTRDGKRLAPAGLEPGEGSAWTELEERWQASQSLMHALGARLGEADLSRRFGHPFMGELNAHDWYRMATYHVRHHRRQLSE